MYKPDNYDSSTGTFPLLIFAHGADEAAGGGDCYNTNGYLGGDYLNKIYTTHGPSHFIEQGTGVDAWPSYFTNPKTGAQEKFIVLSLQYPIAAQEAGDTLDYVAEYMIDHYKVDPNRIYTTGLSYGGDVVTEYNGHYGTYRGTNNTPLYRPAATVPLSI